MGGKKYSGIILLLCMAMFMTGCGSQFPEMTEDQYNQTVEYAAGLLMRYSNNGQERLIYVDAKELEKERKKEAKEAEKEQKAAQPVTPPAPATPVEPVAEPETTPEAASEDTVPEEQPVEPEVTEVADAGQGASAEPEQPDSISSQATDPNAVVLSSDDSEEIMDGIFLSYQGYMVTSTYPESSKSYVVNADKGKKLLVLRFDLYNGTDSSKTVNMIPLNLLFQIVLNGKNLGYSSVTFLPNDLSSYTGSIDSRAHESVVVLTQIDAASASKIETLGMIASIKGVQQTIELR